MGANAVIFWLLAALILGFALFTMTRRNPVTAVMSLVATFFFLAVMYATLDAHFLAVLQVLVYAGAIMVLFIFVVMILNREEVTPVSLRPVRLLGVAAGIFLLATFWPVASVGTPDPGPGPLAQSFGTVGAIGDLLFREFLYPFEAISLLLMVAIVGGVVVSRSAQKEVAAMRAAEQRRQIQELSLHDYPGAGHEELPAAPDHGHGGGASGAGGGHH
jgi:NADH-quinone oxidoreductase subunit J